VIAVASPVPAFASSHGTIDFSGLGCKLPGNSNDVYKGYAFEFTASNTTAAAVSINITSADLDGTDLGSFTVVDLSTCTELGNPFNIPANTDLTNLVLLTSDAPNSQNGTLTVNFEVDGGAEAPATASATGLGPIQGSCNVFSDTEIDCLNSLAAG
jgi:hypothetical protein